MHTLTVNKTLNDCRRKRYALKDFYQYSKFTVTRVTDANKAAQAVSSHQNARPNDGKMKRGIFGESLPGLG